MYKYFVPKVDRRGVNRSIGIALAVASAVVLLVMHNNEYSAATATMASLATAVSAAQCQLC
jgi:hypothetical protein